MIVKEYDTGKIIFEVCYTLLESVNTANELNELDKRNIIQGISYIAGLTGCSFSKEEGEK